MREKYQEIADFWSRLGPRFLPFADAASAELPLSRILRLSLFQVSVGMAVVLLTGTLNRVMIVELLVPTWLVATMVSLPLLFAPFRALIGFKSDTYKSYLGVRRIPYIWYGSIMQFGGLAIMPFALLVLSGDVRGGSQIWGHIGAALAFLMVGVGMHLTQTAGLALATDLATPPKRPRIVALLYVMLLLGMTASAIILSALLEDFSAKRLIQVVQGAAVFTIVLNFIALWKQEVRNPQLTSHDREYPSFSEMWNSFSEGQQTIRLLVAVGLGAAGFSMQEILLEPYGAQVLGLSVSATTMLTALFASGTLAGLVFASRLLSRNTDPMRVAGYGVLLGIFAFGAIVYSGPIGSATLFRCGTALIGTGGGLFVVGTMTTAMAMTRDGNSGIAVGAWSAVYATATGLALGGGGYLKDGVSSLAEAGVLGAALDQVSVGYIFVYHIEILLLFFALVAIGPLVRTRHPDTTRLNQKLTMSEIPS